MDFEVPLGLKHGQQLAAHQRRVVDDQELNHGLTP
jgi:hypothetical protein